MRSLSFHRLVWWSNSFHLGMLRWLVSREMFRFYCSRCERLLQFRIPQSGCECRKAIKGKVTLIQDEISRGRVREPEQSTATSFGAVLLRSILPSYLLRRRFSFSARCNDLQIHEHLERTTLLQNLRRSRLETYCGRMYFDMIAPGLAKALNILLRRVTWLSTHHRAMIILDNAERSPSFPTLSYASHCASLFVLQTILWNFFQHFLSSTSTWCIKHLRISIFVAARYRSEAIVAILMHSDISFRSVSKNVALICYNNFNIWWN